MYQRRYYKNLFEFNLQPFLSMLESRQAEMNPIDWHSSVSRTRSSICENPVQYLGTDLPSYETTRKLVEEIFSDFLDKFDQIVVKEAFEQE
jgi:hypothetical protein